MYVLHCCKKWGKGRAAIDTWKVMSSSEVASRLVGHHPPTIRLTSNLKHLQRNGECGEERDAQGRGEGTGPTGKPE